MSGSETTRTERMEEPKARDPAEDLAMIRRLMQQSRGMVQDAAVHYLLWGGLVTAGLLLTWASATGLIGLGLWWIWPVAIGAGWVGSTWIGYRQDRAARVSTPAGRVMSGIWLGAGVTMTLIGFVGMGTGALGSSAMMAALASIMGAAYFATGALHESRWPRLVAAGWWAGAVALFLWPGVHALLVMAGLMAAFHLVPGLVIHRGGRGSAGGTRREQPA